MTSSFQSSRSPLSPASPPLSGYKQQVKETPPNRAPASPLSPPYMSVATKSYVSSYENNRHSDEMAQRPPRSPANNYPESAQRVNTDHPETPNNLKRPLQEDEDTRPESKRQRMEGFENRTDTNTQIAPTNHDRQGTSQQEVAIPGLSEPVVAQSTDVKIEDTRIGRPSQGQDEKEIGRALLLCQSTHPRSLPDPSQHLMGKYGLGSLLQTMARNDPITGEKINKLRKSYEGQIKPFGLPGRIKPYAEPREKDRPGKLRALAILPEIEYEKGVGQFKIEVTDDLRAKLDQALQINPGTLPKATNLEWEDVLGHEKQKPVVPQPAAVPAALARVANGNRTPPPLSAPSADKMRTRGKKRSYDDSSFIGWGEGYSDAEQSDRDYGERRKRKKE